MQLDICDEDRDKDGTGTETEVDDMRDNGDEEDELVPTAATDEPGSIDTIRRLCSTTGPGVDPTR